MPSRLHPVTPAQRVRILKRDSYTCQYCFGDAVEVDHVVPHSYDADSSDENLVASCVECNRLASNIHFPSFIQKYMYVKRRRAQRGERANPAWHTKAVRAMMEEETEPPKVKAIKPKKPKAIKPPKLKPIPAEVLFMSHLLKSLYEEMYGDPAEPGKMENLTELGILLADEVKRKPPWTAHHLNAVMMDYKGFAMTRELQTAIEALTGKRDGVHPLKAHLVEIMVHSINGNVAPGSIITGHSTRCPGCLVLFVPHHNLQVYCGKECPGRPLRRCSGQARRKRTPTGIPNPRPQGGLRSADEQPGAGGHKASD